MKIFKLLLLSLCLVIASENLFAAPVKLEGVSSLREGVLWQKVICDQENAGYRAFLPEDDFGDCRTMVREDGAVVAFSKQAGSCYILIVQDPLEGTSEEILQELRGSFPTHAQVTLFPKQENILLSAEIRWTERSGESYVYRFYGAKDCSYWAVVVGEDLSCASYFFDSIQITK